MVEIGVPVYKARDTLPALLDTIVAQTRKTIIVCLSIDGDGIDYSDIIETYRTRGLRIRVINSKENGGPGAARQRVFDTTQCPYIMFADADDLLMPRAVEILYRSAVSGGYDILRSHFIREQRNQSDLLLKARDSTITWFHGKIYRTQYIKSLGVKVPSHLKTDEDAYFNLIAWYGTKNRGFVDETTYIWRDNKNSITRSKTSKQYFIDTNHLYIESQVEALLFLFEHNIEIEDKLITFTLSNIYSYYMHAKYYHCREDFLDEMISQLKGHPRITKWLNVPQNWMDIINTVKPGDKYEDGSIVFYQETFNVWASRLLKGEN